MILSSPNGHCIALDLSSITALTPSAQKELFQTYTKFLAAIELACEEIRKADEALQNASLTSPNIPGAELVPVEVAEDHYARANSFEMYAHIEAQNSQNIIHNEWAANEWFYHNFPDLGVKTKK